MAPTAQTKMKALVVSRLLLGDINDWEAFRREREVAGNIPNRRMARSVSAQIGRTYSELTSTMQGFIRENFARCDYVELEQLCDAVIPGFGINLRLDEFEQAFFPLADSVKIRVPFYAHVCISTYGLQFDYPERHFIQDLKAGFSDLRETMSKIDELGVTDKNMKNKRDQIAPLINREKFVSRSMVSSAFSLVESFTSGLLYTALNTRKLGRYDCRDDFLKYAETKEFKDALKDRLARIVKFASEGAEDGSAPPFSDFIRIGKYYRDSIHHTTPFGRKNLEIGERLEALYNIKCDVAIACSLLALNVILHLSLQLYGENDERSITKDCKELGEQCLAFSIERGISRFT